MGSAIQLRQIPKIYRWCPTVNKITSLMTKFVHKIFHLSSGRVLSIKKSLKSRDFVEHFYDGSGEVRSIYQSSMVGEVPGTWIKTPVFSMPWLTLNVRILDRIKVGIVRNNPNWEFNPSTRKLHGKYKQTIWLKPIRVFFVLIINKNRIFVQIIGKPHQLHISSS